VLDSVEPEEDHQVVAGLDLAMYAAILTTSALGLSVNYGPVSLERRSARYLDGNRHRGTGSKAGSSLFFSGTG
jgi:hypothetical protein